MSYVLVGPTDPAEREATAAWAPLRASGAQALGPPCFAERRADARWHLPPGDPGAVIDPDAREAGFGAMISGVSRGPSV